MRLRWSQPARDDLARLHDFLAPLNPEAAIAAVRELLAGVEQLPFNPRLGRSLDIYRPRDVRRLVVGLYEIRYEVRDDDIIIVRLFHGREDRPSGLLP